MNKTNNFRLLFLLLMNLFFMAGCDDASTIENDEPETSATPHEHAGYWESESMLTGLDYYDELWLGITIHDDGTVTGDGGIYVKGVCVFMSDGICFSYSWSGTKGLSVSGDFEQIEVGSDTYSESVNPVNDNEIELTFNGGFQSTIYRQE
jgi:hypothetical protein